MRAVNAAGGVRVSALPRATVAATLAWHSRQVLGLAWAGPVLVSGDVAVWDAGDLAAAASPARRRAGSGSAP